MDRQVNKGRATPAEEYTDGGDVDLDQEVLRDAVTGKRITEADANRLADEAERQAPPGRPSLSGKGSGVSPQVAFRVAEQTKATLRGMATAQGRRETDIAREALEEYLDRHTLK